MHTEFTTLILMPEIIMEQGLHEFYKKVAFKIYIIKVYLACKYTYQNPILRVFAKS